MSYIHLGWDGHIIICGALCKPRVDIRCESRESAQDLVSWCPWCFVSKFPRRHPWLGDLWCRLWRRKGPGANKFVQATFVDMPNGSQGFHQKYPLKDTTVLYNLSTVGHFPIVNMPTSTHAVHAVHQTACHCLRISSMELDVKNILGSFQYSKVESQDSIGTHHKGIGFHVGLWGIAWGVLYLWVAT